MIQKESCRMKTLVAVHHTAPLSLMDYAAIVHFEEKRELFESALDLGQCKTFKFHK